MMSISQLQPIQTAALIRFLKQLTNWV